MTPAQQIALAKFAMGETHSGYSCKTPLPTLRALVRLGYLKDVTPRGPGALFSPTTHFKFKRIK